MSLKEKTIVVTGGSRGRALGSSRRWWIKAPG
jgi:NAD(P)-dependent dehydrogenase (short-subunit alcohol dehydrogenase family)